MKKTISGLAPVLAGLLTVPAFAGPMMVRDAAFMRQLSGVRTAFLKTHAQSLAQRRDDRAHRLVSERLRGSGIPQRFIDAAFLDPRVKIHPEIAERFAKPGEALPYDRYRRIFITPGRIKAGAKFYQENRALLDAVSRRRGVDPFVILAISGVETYYGRYTGKYPVFSALYTAVHKVPKRSAWAARELAEWLIYVHADGLDPHVIKGSYAGAFSYGQFIPSSFNAYAIDFDGDGTRDPYEWPDVLASISNYLVRNGYRPGETDYSPSGSVWRGIYAYNHSDNYVKVVLELRSEILRILPPGA